MKILIIGSNGYLGSGYSKYLYYKNKEFDTLITRIYNYFELKNIVKHYDLVINCASYVGKPNVDAAELHKAESIIDNVTFPKLLVDACYDSDVKLIHVSSGCIYNGYDKHFSEIDKPNFTFRENYCSFYSGTKALAEELLQPYPNVYICRMRIPFDHEHTPRNYISKILNYQKLLNCDNSFSHKEDFIKYSLMLFENYCDTGIYNLTNPDYLSTKDVCEIIKKYDNREFIFFETLEDFNNIVSTPRSNCILDTSKIESVFNIRDVYSAMSDSIEKYFRQ